MRRALKKSGDQELGRSRGGFGTKIHAACDGLGNPVKFLLTPGQTHDITQAEPLLEGLAAEYVIADKGYDGDRLLRTIKDQGERPSFLPRATARFSVRMTNNCTENATTSSDCLGDSSNVAASQLAMTKPPVTSWRSYT